MIRLVAFLIGLVTLVFLIMRTWRIFRGNKLKLVLLDRDGVINEDREDYVKCPEEFEFVEGSIEAIKRLNNAEIKVVVVTNQGGIGRGLYTKEDLEEIHGYMRQTLAEAGAHVDQIFFCADHPDSPTERRKPGAGMLREALAYAGVRPEETCMVGDDMRDLIPAANCKINRHLVLTGKGQKTLRNPDFHTVAPVQVHENLNQAVERILG